MSMDYGQQDLVWLFVMEISQPICFSNCGTVLVGVSLAEQLQGALDRYTFSINVQYTI